tara:strand:- start:339 stop:533 length:195 start_codon:yes stop_codon:yes gene_type:complete
MKVGDLVRYTSTGDKLGVGIVLNICKNDNGLEGFDRAEVVFSDVVKWPVRVISLYNLEVINESQ